MRNVAEGIAQHPCHIIGHINTWKFTNDDYLAIYEFRLLS